MKVVKFPNRFKNHKETNMILGAFDAIHNGHLKMILKAKETEFPVTVLIVNDVLKLPKDRQIFYETLNIRLQKLAMLGVNQVVVLDFVHSIRVMNGMDFIAKLKKEYNVKSFYVGKDYKFGIGAYYNAQTLKEEYPSTQICDIEKINSQKLSSNILKEQVEFGDFHSLSKISPLKWMTEHNVKKENVIEISNKQTKPEPGIYLCKAIFNKEANYIIVHINLSNKIIFKTFDSQINFQYNDIQIWWEKTIRRIIKKETDYILLGDEDFAKDIILNK